jgi:hypothetical protein
LRIAGSYLEAWIRFRSVIADVQLRRGAAQR